MRQILNGHAVPVADRLPPQNLEAERKTLGCCLHDSRVIDDILAAGLRPDDFARAVHGEVWRAMVAMHSRGDSVDAMMLGDYLEREGTLEKFGGNDLLAELCESVAHAANANYYAGIVREKAVGRRLIETCTDLIRTCYSNQYTASDLICEAQEKILAMGERDGGVETVSYRALVEETMARMTVREEGDMVGLSTGFPDLDRITGGFRPGELWILAARPSMGKSALALDLVENVAGLGTTTLFFSVEMGRDAVGDRVVSNEAGVSGDRFQRPWQLDQRERQRIIAAAAKLQGLPVEIDFSPVRTVAAIGAVARRLQRRHGLSMLAVDYLQLLTGVREENGNREQEVARLSKDLKALARSMAVPVLTLAQLNREVEKRADKTPVLSDLRESGSLEQDADVVLLLHRPEYYRAGDRPGVAELIVAKNRNGRTGIVPLTFEASCTRFTSAARDYAPPGISDDTSF